MKRFSTFLLCFFALLWLCLAGPAPRQKVPFSNKLVDPDNFKMANDAAKKANADLEHRHFYAFLEKWQSHNSAEECASGFSHVRLVVGQYMDKIRGRKTLDANAYDLVKEPNTPALKKIYGGPWDHNVEKFWANHYYKEEKDNPEDKGWLMVSKPNSYVYGGELKPGIIKESSISTNARNEVQNYLLSKAEHLTVNGQPYNVAGKFHGTNYVSFAEALLDTIIVDDSKEKCE